MKNRMDLALNIAIGSSIQVALFIAPVLVFASYAFGQPMDLVFHPPEHGSERQLRGTLTERDDYSG
jgi:Ca2+:H+ antiporter